MNGRFSSSDQLLELSRWIQRQIDDGRARVVLRQRADGSNSNQTVREWPLADATAAELAAKINARAMEDALHQRGPVHYGLFAYAVGQKSYVDRWFVDVAGGAGEAGAGSSNDATSSSLATLDDDSERAQKSNLIGLLMKHTHASAQLALGHTVDIVRHYKDESERKDQRIRELEDRHSKVLAMYEELLSMKHERELEQLRATGSEKRKDHLMEKLDMLIPVAISKVLPAAKTAALGEELMRQLLKSLNREQLAGIVGQLQPEQAALIHEIYVAYAEREEARDAKKKNGTNGTANGATNGAGHA
jgi:hypothetical protein